MDVASKKERDDLREVQWFSMLASGGKAADQAISELFDTYSKKFLTYLLGKRLSYENAEDIIEEFFMKLLRQRGEVQNVAYPRAYIWQMLNNTLVSFYRKEGRSTEVSMEPEVIEQMPVMKCAIEDQDYLECVQTTFALFKQSRPKQVEAFELAVFGGLNLKEVADVLGKKHGTIRQSVSAARKAFSDVVSKACGVNPNEVVKLHAE